MRIPQIVTYVAVDKGMELRLASRLGQPASQPAENSVN